MSSRVYEDTTRWTAGPGILRRLQEAGRHVARTLTNRHDPATESSPASAAVYTKRDREGIRPHVDLEEVARREEIQLVRRVFFPPGLKARRTVLFAGVEGENGCAGVCVRAGQTLARLAPQSVCVVDANVRRPVLHRLVGGDNHDGFATAVGRPGAAAMFARRWAPENMWLLPSGSSSPSDVDSLLTVERARACLLELAAQFDRLVVNAPPINLYAESLALSQLVDGVVLVLEANVTRREIVRNMKTRLEDLDVPLLGIVLNDRTFPIPNALYRLL